MMIIKLDEGMIEKLLRLKIIEENQSKNLKGKELTLELKDSQIAIQSHKEKMTKWLEISDANGSFGIWIELTKDKQKKLRQILRKGP